MINNDRQYEEAKKMFYEWADKHSLAQSINRVTKTVHKYDYQYIPTEYLVKIICEWCDKHGFGYTTYSCGFRKINTDVINLPCKSPKNDLYIELITDEASWRHADIIFKSDADESDPTNQCFLCIPFIDNPLGKESGILREDEYFIEWNPDGLTGKLIKIESVEG